MSVLACSRSECDNIMCDRLYKGEHYVCDECFLELTRLGTSITAEWFLRTPKSLRPVSIDAWDYWNDIMPASDKGY